MNETKTALELAAAALARRDRSTANLAAYLVERGVHAGEAARAVERLVEAGYVDDERYAVARAEALAARGYGDQAIRAELARGGVAAEAAEAALAALEPEPVRARLWVARRGATATIARRLLAKGFDPEVVEEALSEA